MPSSVKKFDFHQLESVSPGDLHLMNTLRHYAPAGRGRQTLLRRLEQVLQHITRGGCTLHSRGFRLEEATAWKGRLGPARSGGGEAAVYTVLSAVPGGPQAILVWEPILVLALIDRILAGELTEVPGLRSLSDIERGVLSYVMAKLCQACHGELAAGAMPIRLERIHEDSEAAANLVSSAEQVAVAEVTIALPELSGVMQVVLPDLFIREVMATQARPEPDEAARMASGLEELGDLSFDVSASIGRATLTHREVSQLEAGDIVLLDESQCRYADGHLQGEVTLRPRQHGVPTVVAAIQDVGPPAKLAVTSIIREA